MPGLAQTLDWHITQYPLLQAEDVYKLVHQAAFGPGHAITDELSARQSLEKEFVAIAEEGEPVQSGLTEPLDPAGTLIRVNLRPLMRHHDPVGLLVPMMVATAVSGCREKMALWMGEAQVWCAQFLPDQCDRLREFAERNARRTGYRPLHHSAVARAAYRPAYRVISAVLYRRAFPGHLL